MCCTFPHVTKGVLVGFISAHAPLHVRGVHARLIGRVGRHVLPRESRVTSFSKRVLQVNTAPTSKAKTRGRRGSEISVKKGRKEGQKEIRFSFFLISFRSYIQFVKSCRGVKGESPRPRWHRGHLGMRSGRRSGRF